jgi:hypothetical protein
MPINVSCSNCHFDFHVGDEFAGLLGRCPGCETVLQVPATEPVPQIPEPHVETDPYHSHQSAKAFDEFPSRRVNYDDYRGPEVAQAKNRDAGPPVLRFDKEARAARWHAVSNGLRNLMVSVILVAVSQGVWLAFLYADGVHPGQQNQFGPREKALNIGDVVFLSLGLGLWGIGRIACGRVPYVPARRVARPAAIIAGLATGSGVVGLSGLVFGIMLLQQNLGAGALLFLVGFCSLLPAMLGFVVAEVMGLVSQMRIATGLRDPAFARASRVQFALALLLSAVCMVGSCGLFMFWGTETNKKQEQIKQKEREKVAEQEKNNDADVKGKVKDAPPKEKEKEVPPPADKQKGKGKQPGNGPGGQQQQPPKIDWGEYPELLYAMWTSWLLVVLTYTLASVICFQLGRSAIRREIAHLLGSPHDHDPGHHYHN